MPADRERLDAAWTALAELGITLADLQRDARPPMPTCTGYLPQVLAAAGPGTLRAYRSYWQRMTTAWGVLAIDTASDIQALRRDVVASARARRNIRGSRHAGELLITAAREPVLRPSWIDSSAPSRGLRCPRGSRCDRRRRRRRQCRVFYSLRAVWGPVMRCSSGSTEATIAAAAARPPPTVR